MLRLAAFLIVMLSLCVMGCAPDKFGWGGADSGDDTSITGPAPLSCSGACITTAPATFTGPSLFWFGVPDLTPHCPDETPNQGIQGYVDDPSPWFARECLITPTDACAEEGETCAPVPEESYQLCIHHTDKIDCRDDYSERRTMFDMESGIEVTVCCMAAPLE